MGDTTYVSTPQRLAHHTNTAAPAHASSAALSPHLSAGSDGRRDRVTSGSTITALCEEHCCPQYYGESHDGCSVSPSLSSRQCDTPPRSENMRASSYSSQNMTQCVLPPEQLAVFFSQKDKHKAPTHSSTATHQQRARCGCHGIAVQIDSGPLGLSLEASYGVNGLMLQQAWSDCDIDCDVDKHSVRVQEKRGRGVRNRVIRGTNVGVESRSSSSGLIKVRTAHIKSSTPTPIVAPPPLPLRQGVRCSPLPAWEPRRCKEERKIMRDGILAVEEGDILVRIDHVQVQRNDV